MDNLSVGFVGASRFSGQRGRTADGMNRSGVRYPSPFFDISQTWLPSSMKALLHWCRYYYLTNPLINAVIHKMSEYPITELVLEEENEALRKQWAKLLDGLRMRAFQIEVGLDYNTYGICVVTMHFPFEKWLTCSNPGCKVPSKLKDKKTNKPLAYHPFKVKAKKIRYRWRQFNYVIECPNCGYTGPAKVEDHYIKDVRKIRLVRWNPEYIFIDQGFAGQDPIYTFELPKILRNDLAVGKKHLLDTIPDTFVEAIKRGKNIRFAPENVFVFKRPIISQKEHGWGMPLILPVLKDTFYLQILRKAQEMIAQEHIVPLRIMFPQANGNTSDPYTTINLENWKQIVEGEMAKWKYDQNYIPILPLPIGNQTVGGDGKALGLYQEMEVWSRHIVAGMGVPEEFIFGGMQYSGSNVSMRMLENQFIGYRLDHENMLNNFIIRSIATYMGWKPVSCRMRRFKMADDLQRLGLQFQMYQGDVISKQSILEEADFDIAREEERQNKELDRKLAYNRRQQIGLAEIQGEQQVIMAKYGAQAQEHLMPPPGDPSGQISGVGGEGGTGGGAEGEMIPGQQADPAMPEGSTVSQTEGRQAPTEGVPTEMQSPLQAGKTNGGGYNLITLAKRAASEMKKMDPMQRTASLERMRGTSPELYQITMRFLIREQGSQVNQLNPMQSPLPQQKPERRTAHVGV
jgi:hypothetical protein